MVEHAAVNRGVTGSSPVWGAREKDVDRVAARVHLFLFICIAPADFNLDRPLADEFMIEISRWPRGVASLARRIEVFRRKIEMCLLERCIS